MEKRSKLISGLTDRKIVQKPNKYFTDPEKHLIIQEMLETKCTKQEVWAKYTGQKEEHGQILRWMRKLGYDESIPTRRPNFVSKPILMKDKKQKDQGKDSFENLQLRKRIAEL